MRMTLRAKLLTASLFYLLLLACTLLLGMYNLALNQQRLQESVERDMATLAVVSNLSAKVGQVRAAVLSHILTTSNNEMARDEAEIARLDSDLHALSSQLEAMHRTGGRPAHLEPITAFREAWETYAQLRDQQLLPLSRRNRDLEAFALASPDGAAGSAAGTAVAELEHLRAILNDDARATVALSEQQQEQTRLVLLLISVMGGGIGVLFALRHSASVGRAVNALAIAASQVAGGDFSRRVEVKTGDEIQRVAESFNTMTEHLEQTRAALDQKVTEAEAAGDSLRAEATLRQQAEAALRLSEERYRLALRATQDIVYDRDIARGTLIWNENTLPVLGYAPDELGSSVGAWTEKIHPEDLPAAEKQLNAALERGELFTSVYRFLRKDGAYAYLYDRGWVLRNAEGKAVRLVGAVLDLTERKRAEDEYAELLARAQTAHASAERHQAEAEALADLVRRGAAERDTDQAVTVVCEQACRLLGADYAGVQLKDQDGCTRWHGMWGNRSDAWRQQRRTQGRGPATRALAIGQTVVVQHLPSATEEVASDAPVYQSEGARTLLATPLVPGARRPGALVLGWRTEAHPTAEQMRLAEALAGYAVTVLDNAWAHEEAEQRTAELATSEARLRTLYEALACGVIVRDSAGRITHLNAAAEEILGVSLSQARGRTTDTLWQATREDGSLLPAEERAVGVALRTRLPVRGRIQRIIRPDGVGCWLQIDAVPILSADGQPLQTVASFFDITERKRVEQELEQASDAAQSASRAKSEFLANMSHEIRTPMNAILGMAELLAETPLAPEQREYVRIFRRAGEGLLELINDILDLSKVEAAQIELAQVDFDLVEVVEGVGEVLAVRAHEKGLELTCQVLPDVPRSLRGDPQRLRQVLVNLLGNAIKFTEQGEVGLRVEREPGATEAGMLRCAVWDTGIGIATEHQEAIFGTFTQVDASSTRQYGGTGLGLTISKRLVELMGGRLWVESAPGQGARFCFTTHFAPGWQEQAGAVAPAAELSGRRILVVDDNATNRLILRQTLGSRGALVKEAAGGSQGIAELRRARDAAEPYDVALVDRHMPGMDGFELVERIKQDVGKLDVAIIMLTSGAQHADTARARALGLAGYLAKPIKCLDLLRTIGMALGQPPRPEPSPLAETQAEALESPRPLRILLAEDSEDNRLVIQAYLKYLPHQLDIAETGGRALETYCADRYDVVLMDMQMPGMDGYAATRAIRAWEAEHQRPPTPILALTASALAEDVRRCMEAGCSAHLAKPISKTVLLEALTTYTGGGPNPAAVPAQRRLVRVDAERAALMGDLIPGFLERRRGDVAALQEAVEHGEYSAVRRLGHDMKGSGAAYGFAEITSIGQALETAANVGDAKAIVRLAGELAEYLDQVEVLLDAPTPPTEAR